jgi:hypothetical protein
MSRPIQRGWPLRMLGLLTWAFVKRDWQVMREDRTRLEKLPKPTGFLVQRRMRDYGLTGRSGRGS